MLGLYMSTNVFGHVKMSWRQVKSKERLQSVKSESCIVDCARVLKTNANFLDYHALYDFYAATLNAFDICL